MKRKQRQRDDFADVSKSILYKHMLTEKFFRDCPKDVFAALAVSLASQGGDYLDTVEEKLKEEWQILYEQGLVKQKPR